MSALEQSARCFERDAASPQEHIKQPEWLFVDRQVMFPRSITQGFKRFAQSIVGGHVGKDLNVAAKPAQPACLHMLGGMGELLTARQISAHDAVSNRKERGSLARTKFCGEHPVVRLPGFGRQKCSEVVLQLPHCREQVRRQITDGDVWRDGGQELPCSGDDVFFVSEKEPTLEVGDGDT